MKQKEVMIVKLIRNLSLGLIILLIIGGAVFYDLLLNEDRDYRLYDQLRLLAIDIEQYKKDNGHYPTDIKGFGRGNKLCVYELYKKCSDIKYKPNPDLSSYKMVTKSFTGDILYYDSTRMVGEEQVFQDGSKCYYCSIPRSLYKTNSWTFPKPEEWPDL